MTHWPPEKKALQNAVPLEGWQKKSSLVKHRMSDLVKAAFLLDHVRHGRLYMSISISDNTTTIIIIIIILHTSTSLPTFNSVHHWLPGQNTAEWQVRGLLESDVEKWRAKPSVVSYHPSCLGANCCSQGAWDAGMLLTKTHKENTNNVRGEDVGVESIFNYEINTFRVESIVHQNTFECMNLDCWLDLKEETT